MMPDYRLDNPYQSLLLKALQAEGINVIFPQGYRRILPISRALQAHPAVEILHLHWLNPYWKGRTWLVRWIYSIKFLVDVWLSKKQGYKVVWTIHNLLSHETRFPGLELWTIRQFVKLVDRIIVHHQAVLADLATLYQFNPDKAEIISHGHYRGVYGEPIASPEARAILGLPPTGKLYLNLGMLRPYKGIERLLRIWQNHPEVTAEHTLLIAGKPLNDAYGQELAEQVATTKGSILHLGFVENHLVPIYFSAADFIVLPFKNILTSGSLLLAMSYAKAIIAPRSSGIVETLGAADWLLYDPEQDQGLQDQGLLWAIRKATEIDTQKLGSLINDACNRLDWNAIGAKTARLYGQLSTNSRSTNSR